MGYTKDYYVSTAPVNQTIEGIKTFTSMPLLPDADPVTLNQAVRKKYVDNLTGGGKEAAVLIATQTFTGRNTFANRTTIAGDAIVSSGNLGIGVANPTYKLEVWTQCFLSICLCLCKVSRRLSLLVHTLCDCENVIVWYLSTMACGDTPSRSAVSVIGTPCSSDPQINNTSRCCSR